MLVQKVGVAGVPGSSFYSPRELGKTKVRFMFAKREETLHEAGRRFAQNARNASTLGMRRRTPHDYGKTKAKRERRFALKVAEEETGRQCGECTACCMVMGVAEVPTPFYSACPRQTETGCGVYDKHPGACRDFYCEWLVGGLTEDDRPDKLGLVFVSTRTVDGGKQSVVVAAYEVWSQAADSERARAIFATSNDDVVPFASARRRPSEFARSGRAIRLHASASARIER